MRREEKRDGGKRREVGRREEKRCEGEVRRHVNSKEKNDRGGREKR